MMMMYKTKVKNERKGKLTETVFALSLYSIVRKNIFFLWRNSPQTDRASSFTRFQDRTQRRTTVGKTPPNGWLAHCGDLYLTKLNIHNRQTSMPALEFEPTISACEQLQTYGLDRVATETGQEEHNSAKIQTIRLVHIMYWLYISIILLN